MSEVTVYHGDNVEVLKWLPDASVDAVVTDPPYGLSDKTPDPALVAEVLRAWLDGREVETGGRGFMGRSWDAFVPGPAVWRECLRVLKPGGHLVAFFGTRTYDLGAIAVRLAGFEVRDLIAWLYGSGFPKSLNVAKAIEATLAGALDGEVSLPAALTWDGWGTALKPALEPVVFARKPLIGTLAENVLAHGCGGLNIDSCRVSTDGESFHVPKSDPARRQGVVGRAMQSKGDAQSNQAAQADSIRRTQGLGRWPANVVHDGSDEVVEAFPESESGGYPPAGVQRTQGVTYGRPNKTPEQRFTASSGSASRFFYSAKADAEDRMGSDHPTVKPIDLMAWLARLITPPGGTVLDPFAGSGTTGIAALREGFDAILIELDGRHVADIRLRLDHARGLAPHSASIKARNKKPKVGEADLFGDDR